MNWILTALALISVTASAGEPRTYTLDGAYGSLVYEGKVQRIEGQDSVLFHVKQLRLTFVPTADVNATDQVVRPPIRLITTTRAPDGVKAVATYEALIKTGVTLNASEPVAVLDNLLFSVPASTLSSADYAELSVTDGLLLWPIHQDIRP